MTITCSPAQVRGDGERGREGRREGEGGESRDSARRPAALQSSAPDPASSAGHLHRGAVRAHTRPQRSVPGSVSRSHPGWIGPRPGISVRSYPHWCRPPERLRPSGPARGHVAGIGPRPGPARVVKVKSPEYGDCSRRHYHAFLRTWATWKKLTIRLEDIKVKYTKARRRISKE